MASLDFPIEQIWRVLIRDLGSKPADVLRRARLPEDLFRRSDARLTRDEYFRFWDSLGEEIDDPAFPIRLVERVTAETFMPPLFAAICSPNLTVALRRLSKYKRLIAPMTLEVSLTSDALEVSIEWLDSTVAPPATLSGMEVSFIVQLARMGTRERICPARVTAPNPPQPAAAYERFLGVGVERGPRLALCFRASDAELPFLTANDAMWKTFEPELRRRLADLDDAAPVHERVRVALLESLPSGQASVVAVAERLAMSKRTLQRRLAREGTTFQEVLQETRRVLARHYLAKTRLSCSEISFLLGFEEPSSFFRAYHEWNGTSPEADRPSLSA